MPRRPSNDSGFPNNRKGLRFKGEPVARPKFGRRPMDDEDDLDELPSPEDIERFSDATRICPECNKQVFDDSAICYHCGHAFDRSTGAWGKSSGKQALWITIIVIILLATFLFFTLGHFW
jgi:hypothetical protein